MLRATLPWRILSGCAGVVIAIRLHFGWGTSSIICMIDAELVCKMAVQVLSGRLRCSMAIPIWVCDVVFVCRALLWDMLDCLFCGPMLFVVILVGCCWRGDYAPCSQCNRRPMKDSRWLNLSRTSVGVLSGGSVWASDNNWFCVDPARLAPVDSYLLCFLANLSRSAIDTGHTTSCMFRSSLGLCIEPSSPGEGRSQFVAGCICRDLELLLT